MARRLRGGAARAVHRLQPAAARRRARARHPDQPRRPDPDAARARRHRPRPGARPAAADHTDARPLVGRDLSDAIRAAEPAAPSEPILFTTDDEISEGSATPASPFQRFARRLHRYSTVKQPNHLQTVIAEVDVDGEQHLVKFSRYHDNEQFWTVPGERDERLQRPARPSPSPSPNPTSTSSTTSRSTRSRSATSPTPATPTTAPRALQQTMLALLARAARRQAPHPVSRRGARLPAARAVTSVTIRRRERATRKPRLPVELSGVFELRASTR